MGKNLYWCLLAVLLGAGHLFAQPLPHLNGQKITLRLLSQVSSKEPSGSPFEARLDAPLVEDGKILLPEGTILKGEVTTKHARRLYRAGSLRLVFKSLSFPDGSIAGTDMALQNIQADPSARRRLAVRVDDEGGVHSHLSKKKMLLNISIALAIGKIADDASESLIRSLSLAGARYVAWGSGAAFWFLRSKGATVKLPAGTLLEAVFQRDPVFLPPLMVLPLTAPRGFTTAPEGILP